MKTILFIFFTFISIISFCQKSPYELYSDVWEFGKNGENELTIKPKGKDYFQPNILYIKGNLDTLKIQKYLISSFNEFRKNYGYSQTKEDKIMSNECVKYSKELSVKFKHDVNLPNDQSEANTILPFTLLGFDTTKTMDFNKTVADCIFDLFVVSETHMSILLNEKDKYYGFGFFMKNNKIYICIRSR